jgi:hypothetical protein
MSKRPNAEAGGLCGVSRRNHCPACSLPARLETLFYETDNLPLGTTHLSPAFRG